MSRTTLLPDPVFVTIDNVPIATYLLEPPDPIGDVVFCHGTPWSAYVWAQCAAHLSDRYRVFLWDMPGYGASEQGPAIRTDLATQMQRLGALLDHWQLSEPHVVAHDIGGAVALGAHLLHGNDFRSLSLWDIVTLEPWGSPFFRLVAEHADVFAALPPALHKALVTEYISGAAAHQIADDDLESLCRPWLSDLGQAAFYDQIAHLLVADTRPVAERLHEVRCPTAIGWGEQDPWIPVEQATRLQEALPGNPEPTLLPGVGHLSPLEDPVGLQAALDSLLSSSA